MNIHCDNPCVTCDPNPAGTEGIFPDPNAEANPFSNFSSEKPDKNLFIGNWFNFGTGPNNDGPLIGQPWTTTGCIGVCLSEISQADADLCAAAQQVICDSVNNPVYPFCVTNPSAPSCNIPTPDPCVISPTLPQCQPGPRPIFYNDATSCSQDCGDGTASVVAIPAGMFAAWNKASANAMAETYACNLVRSVRLCLGPLSQTVVCLGSSFSGFIVAQDGSEGVVDVTFNRLGALPPGLRMEKVSATAIHISGVPTVGGIYQFTIRAISTTGPVVEKNYTITVKGLTSNSTLPDATSGVAYSTFLTISPGFTGTPTWTLTGGTLPAGLTLLSSSGEIFGTPTDTEELTYDFVVTLTDSETSCSRLFSITVAAPSCPNWDNIAWDPPSFVAFGAGASASGSVAGPNIIANTSVTDQETENASALGIGFLDYNGPACNGNFHYELDIVDTNGQGGYSFQLLNNTDALIVFNVTTVLSGVYDIPFVIPDTGGVTKQYALTFSGGCGAFTPPPGPSNANAIATISNV